MKKIAIFGAGGFAREVHALLVDLRLEQWIEGFFETDNIWKPRVLAGCNVLPQSRFDPSLCTAVIAVGNPQLRREIACSLPNETEFPIYIHPSVVMSRSVRLAKGSVICAGSILTCDIQAGEFIQLNLMTTVGHDCVLGAFFTTAPSVNISGKCNFGESVYVGTNASFREGVKVASNTIIGMGAVVVKDIPEAGTYVGNPAKLLGNHN